MIFDTDIYKPEAVIKAASDYSGVAKIILRSDSVSGQYECILSDCLYDEALTAKEFANYVLFLSLKNLESIKNET